QPFGDVREVGAVALPGQPQLLGGGEPARPVVAHLVGGQHQAVAVLDHVLSAGARDGRVEIDVERGAGGGPVGPGRPADGVLTDGRRIVVPAGPVLHLAPRGVGDGARPALRRARGRSVAGGRLLGARGGRRRLGIAG